MMMMMTVPQEQRRHIFRYGNRCMLVGTLPRTVSVAPIDRVRVSNCLYDDNDDDDDDSDDDNDDNDDNDDDDDIDDDDDNDNDDDDDGDDDDDDDDEC